MFNKKPTRSEAQGTGPNIFFSSESSSTVALCKHSLSTIGLIPLRGEHHHSARLSGAGARSHRATRNRSLPLASSPDHPAVPSCAPRPCAAWKWRPGGSAGGVFRPTWAACREPVTVYAKCTPAINRHGGSEARSRAHAAPPHGTEFDTASRADREAVRHHQLRLRQTKPRFLRHARSFSMSSVADITVAENFECIPAFPTWG